MAARITIALAMLVAFAGPGLAQPYPPLSAVICPSSAEPPGDSFECEAGGFCPDTSVTVSFDGEVLTQVQADADGNARAELRVPEDAPDGPATITFEGLDATCQNIQTLNFRFNVDSSLPRTGAEGVDRWVVIAAGLLLLGTTMVLASRRRERVHAPVE